MILQNRLFGHWSLEGAWFRVNTRVPRLSQWYVSVAWTPHRWAQWISGPASREAVVDCWTGGATWVYDYTRVSPVLTEALVRHLGIIPGSVVCRASRPK